MNYQYFIGIDISKKMLDVAVLQGKTLVVQTSITNDQKAISCFYKDLLRQLGIGNQWEIVFCMEHTGIYNTPLLDFLSRVKAAICLQSAVEIKYSNGLQRGKNDKVDAVRIAQYAYKNRDDLRLWQPRRDIIKHLKELTALRNRLLGIRKQLRVPLAEDKVFKAAVYARPTQKLCSGTLKAVEKDIAATNAAIERLILADPYLARLFSIIVSIPGIGKVTASEMLITTNEFKDIKDPKKYACYAGVAPFEHSSGSSIRGKTRVSRKANLQVKSLLHMAAMVASVHNPELKQYYQRKVAEGKPKMAVLNAVKNKLILRVFACINQDRCYQKKYERLVA